MSAFNKDENISSKDNQEESNISLKNNKIIDDNKEQDKDKKQDINDDNHNSQKASDSDNEDEDEDEDEIDDEEFKCEECGTVQGLNNCELCDAENVCEECYGQGGDYGPSEIWVCNNCLPTCLECGKQLFTSYDECCGKGRSDLPDEDEDNDE